MKHETAAVGTVYLWLAFVSMAPFGSAYQAASEGSLKMRRGEGVAAGLVLGLLFALLNCFLEQMGVLLLGITGGGWVGAFLSFLGPFSAGVGVELGNTRRRLLNRSGNVRSNQHFRRQPVNRCSTEQGEVRSDEIAKEASRGQYRASAPTPGDTPCGVRVVGILEGASGGIGS
jgi:hypothetical protein